jgi:hypothetical protein
MLGLPIDDMAHVVRTSADTTRRLLIQLSDWYQRGPIWEDAGRFLVGRRWLATGDTTSADSILALVAARGSLWQGRAVTERASISLARHDTATAVAILDAPDRTGWSDDETGTWLALRARAAVGVGDTATALRRARELMLRFPGRPVALRAVALLDTLRAALGDGATTEDELAAIDVAMLAGRYDTAARRMERVLPRLTGTGRVETALRLGTAYRRARRFESARRALADARTGAPDTAWAARLALELARVERDAGRGESARSMYESVARTAAPGTTRDLALRERAQSAEGAGAWELALDGYRALAAGTGHWVSEARFRGGLMHLMSGRPDSALSWWRDGEDEPSRLWSGVLLRRAGDTDGERRLCDLAGRSGYTFHRSLARDTLGAMGWPGALAEVGFAGHPALTIAFGAGVYGDVEDAQFVLARWREGDRRATRDLATRVHGDTLASAPGPDADGWMAAARVAYLCDRPGLAIGYIERALQADSGATDSARWARVPWAFPPAAETLFVAPADTAVAALEPALLFALTYQESRFDPRARSRSDALGLMQLKVGAASDVAGWLRDPKPTEATLFDPTLNVRYGARYLARLIRRFDGSVAAALLAYNAGPGAMPPWWREAIARGGEALLCELASNGDYARKILGYRQAYRELRPTAYAR